MKSQNVLVRARIFLFAVLLSALPLSGAPWKWIAYGDTRTNINDHRAVLQAMALNTPDCTFIINVGDVVEHGSSVAEWNVWQKACDDIFGSSGQDSRPPRYMACPGNHDEVVNTAGLANWKTFLSGQAEQFGNDGKYFYFDYRNARFVILSAAENIQGDQNTLLQKAIATNPQPWLFAIWHNPIFDFGIKQYEGEIHQTWGIPLYENGCDAIFTGHAHHYVRSQKLALNGNKNPPLDSYRGTVQIITGNGGAPLVPVYENTDNNGYMVAYSYDEVNKPYNGYLEIEIDSLTMALKEIRTDGTVMDRAVYTANPKPNITARYVLELEVNGSGKIERVPSDSLLYSGRSVQLTCKPDLGWKFKGWSGDSQGQANPLEVVMDADKHLTATFSELPAGQKELRIEISGSGSVVLNPPGPYYSEGTSVHVQASPDPRWKFKTWAEDHNGSGIAFDIVMDTHKRITATFAEVQTFSVSPWRTGNGTVRLSPSGGAYTEDSKIVVTAVPEASWKFLQWSGDIQGMFSPETLLVDSPKEIGALFYFDKNEVQYLNPTNDTYIRGGFYATRNFSTMHYLEVQESSTDMFKLRSYLKFDLSSLKGQVEAAWLKLTVASDGLEAGAAANVFAYRVDQDNWDENAVIWKNAPEGTVLLDKREAVRSKDSEYAWDVTGFAQSEWRGDKVATFLLKDASASGVNIKFDSKEGKRPPVLVVIASSGTEVQFTENQTVFPFQFKQNYPNPFNPSTTIHYTIPVFTPVHVSIYDVNGRNVRDLEDSNQDAGAYTLVWDGKDNQGRVLPNGVYLCFIRTAVRIRSMKMVFMR